MIYNTSGQQIQSANFALRSAQVEILTITIDCETGRSLSCGAIADCLVEGRLSGVGGYTNLESSSIDLGTWDGTQQDFDIRVTAGTITSYTRRLIPLSVRR